MIGTTLTHYKIVDELGRGGMGIVYKAEDTKLNRTVAIKVLPVSALGSEEDKARFFREAQAAAQLHHANIATVFAIEEAELDGETRPFIAMEFIEGETLSDRLSSGPMKLEETVRITTQVAEALEAAHEKDIVHRDIKGGNVMMTKKGVAKVLDFGLAKTAQSTKLTQLGSTLGTIAYMSPEQARGEEVDRRSDIWSLGVLLYEMISGRLPFAGEYEQAAVYSILNEDPEPLTAIRTGVPMGLEWIVSKLLAKKVSDRYQNISDLLVDLRTLDLKASGMSRISTASELRPATGAAPGGAGPSARRRTVLAPVWAVAGAVLVGLAWLLWPASNAPTSVISPKHFVQSVPMNGSVISVDLSPKGDAVAIASDLVRVLDLKTGVLTAYPEAGVVVHLEFSPDGRSLLLTNSASVTRLSLDNSSVVSVIDSDEGGPRATWMNEEWIIYEDNTTIYRSSLTTGEVLRVTTLDSLAGEYDQDWPYVLPDGKTVMATAEIRDADSRIGFWDIETGSPLKYLDLPGYRPQYLSPGYLLFEMDRKIMSVPFDLKTLSQTGPIRSIAEPARAEGMSLSGDGTMVHAGADIGLRVNSEPVIPLVVDNSTSAKSTVQLELPADRYRNITISPDGRLAAVVVESVTSSAVQTDIWIIDLENQTRRTLTQDGISDYPAWTADGDSVRFVRRDRSDRVMTIAATGRGVALPSRLVNSPPSIADLTISRDGRIEIRILAVSDAALDIQTLMQVLFEDGSFIEPALESSRPRHPSISPDSRFVAYEADGGILILPLDDLDSVPVTVWERGMSLPKWAPDMSKIFALAPDGMAHSVAIQTDPVLTVTGAPKIEINWAVAGISLFDVFPDTEKFILPMLTTSDATAAIPDSLNKSVDLHFFINLAAELE